MANELNQFYSDWDKLRLICNQVSDLLLPGHIVSIRIQSDDGLIESKDFKEGATSIKVSQNIINGREVQVEFHFNFSYSLWKIDLENFVAVFTSLVAGALTRIYHAKLEFDHGERQKELASINRTANVIKRQRSLEEALQQICSFLPEAMQFPEISVARIRYGDKVYTSDGFVESAYSIKHYFDIPSGSNGSLEIYYKEKPATFNNVVFLNEEYNLIDNLSELISGLATKDAMEKLVASNTERLKELKGINITSEILKNSDSLENALRELCHLLPASWQYPNDTVVRISYDKHIFTSKNFRETPWRMVQVFDAPGKKNQTIEVFYLQEFPEADEGPFLKEERNLLINLANLIAGSATRDIFNQLLYENTERLKELKAINQTSYLIENGQSLQDTLQNICQILPMSWQYPDYAVARITFERKEYSSRNFRETIWSQRENFVTIDSNKGSIEIFYTKELPLIHEGPFLAEERNLLINIAKLVAGFLNSQKGREYYNKNVSLSNISHRTEEFRNSLTKNKKPLQLYFNQQSIDKYIYLDMMKYKIKHILFVSTLYDAFTLESEDSFFEKFMGEIYQYSLFSLPRITGASSAEEALELLETTHFDLVLLMVGIDREAPILLSEQIKEKNDSLPVYLLLNKKNEVKYFEELVPTLRSVDKIFVWNGDWLVLFAIVKSIEDKVNVENDTKVGLVRVILLIEDSPLYYSKYLQILYTIVFGQVQQLLPEVEKNELDKICKMRSRPKILLARNYEEAITIFNKYKDFLLCVISDIEFDWGGKLDKEAGAKFIQIVRDYNHNLPVVLQSSELANQRLAQVLEATFIDKNSETLMNDIKKFLVSHLGFGNFVFRDKNGNKIAVAKSLREFETLMKEIPDESFKTHASENQFSLWLMARGEIQLAKTLNPISVNQFSTLSESRQFFLDTIRKYKEEKKKGKILTFDETSTLDEKNIVSFSGGSLGGKGRGLAFINTLIYNLDFSELSKRINILTPITVIVGTDEFQNFLSKNKLHDTIINPNLPYDRLRELFYHGQLSNALMDKLRFFVDQIDKPIAVRSSSTSEDSLTQPFAGVFDTYIIPNSKKNKALVVERVASAIKLVYASIYSDNAKAYFNAINHKVEDERMAVVLQELVGNHYEQYYYPHISGVAQSVNYYPVAHMKPEEGFAVAALGLGCYVVNGWKSFRFSPKYPKVSVYGVKDLINTTQVQFFALDCSDYYIDLLKDGEMASLKLLDISEAEKHGTLKHLVSVYNRDNDRIEPGLGSYGPRIVNFANILKYDYIPLPETISLILNTVKDAFGSPVEIEYAVDLDQAKNGLPTFYLLQIKPLASNQLGKEIEIGKLGQEKMLLLSRSSLGNGELKNIEDVIFVDTAKFSKLKTLEMASEIEYLNRRMARQNRNYVLIGPGRWGTRDQFLGIPVAWSQISNAKIIVETSLENFPLDSSLGSHFFHNVTSMNIGYFSVHHNSPKEFIKWDLFEKQELIEETTYFKQVRFKNPLTILMDGRKKESAILISGEDRV